MPTFDTVNVSAVVRKENGLYVALCPEFDFASQGKSAEEALMNLKEALELYLGDEDVKGLYEAKVPCISVVEMVP